MHQLSLALATLTFIFKRPLLYATQIQITSQKKKLAQFERNTSILPMDACIYQGKFQKLNHKCLQGHFQQGINKLQTNETTYNIRQNSNQWA